jgi:hypothetical protein
MKSFRTGAILRPSASIPQQLFIEASPRNRSDRWTSRPLRLQRFALSVLHSSNGSTKTLKEAWTKHSVLPLQKFVEPDWFFVGMLS